MSTVEKGRAMSNLRPESRIKSLEKRATDIEAAIEELSEDTAESLKAIQQKQQGLFEHVQNGFKQAHDFVQERFADINKWFDKVETDIASIKQDNLGENFRSSAEEIRGIMSIIKF